MALQLLCTLDVQGADAWPAVEPYLAGEPAPAAVKERAVAMARDTFDRHADWDEAITGVSQRWDVRRMGFVDRNILRLALYEMSRPGATPVKVVMDEAIELAKEFGAEESPAFVNGVLDAIWRRRTTAAPPEPSPAHEPAAASAGGATPAETNRTSDRATE